LERSREYHRKYGCRKDAIKGGYSPRGSFDFDKMFHEQSGRCAICGDTSNLSVDHCHSSGVVRGLLCKKCNSGIAFLDENVEIIQRSINYLQRSGNGVNIPCKSLRKPRKNAASKLAVNNNLPHEIDIFECYGI
jgi:Recombination endonuclease VII